jgi:hypothetical protein
MITLTQTIVDVADCNLTLRYFAAAPAASAMPFTAAEPYGTLYESIAQTPRTYADVSGQPGQILAQLRPFYAGNKFWSRYLVSSDLTSYPALAWNSFVPISSTLNQRITVELPKELAGLTVKPEQRVLLYPFGWATWLSFLISGSYSLDDLARLVPYLMSDPAFRLESDPAAPLTLTQLLAGIRKGVQQDAFQGVKPDVMTPPDLLTVTTVLAKHGGGISLGALTSDEEQGLQHLVRPGQPLLQTSVTTMAEPLPLGGDPLLDYVLHDGMSWFIWAEHLLRPEGRLAKRLRCYHNNTFRSLLQARMLQILFKKAVTVKPWSADLSSLVDAAVTLLDSSEGLNDYKNRSLLTFLADDEFQKPVTNVRKRLEPPN